MTLVETMEYHIPVMLTECLEGLNIKPEGTYVDVTFGGGGHSKAILERIEAGKLLSFDQDDDARVKAEEIGSANFTFVQANFRYLKRYLKLHGVKQVDGILADLGISSHQIDVAERGFSTRFDADLDMRMDQKASRTAMDVVNEYPEAELHKVLGMYGEVKNAKTLAAAIVSARSRGAIKSIQDLKSILEKLAPRNREFKYYAQVFQGLRIEVNDEIKALEDLLMQSLEVLAPGGRIVVLSYHSLEDRMVKNFFNMGKFHGEVEKDFFGNQLRPLRAITRKPVSPTEAEIKANNRARSAKLRIAEKV
ncbi:MAG: 16S rRNA (cytosine(1402)-N(4))-methyltransferase RsmH [Bacteroidota bacterium]|nr:16S rRNA (cytosine(1402)-N(4))-methyltransferase RsmH [Bacteroidota bacterium]